MQNMYGAHQNNTKLILDGILFCLTNVFNSAFHILYIVINTVLFDECQIC